MDKPISEGDICLNVLDSFLGRSWFNLPYDENFVEQIKESLNVSELISRILSVQGLGIKELENYINPKIKNLMPNPNLLADMTQAVDRVILGIQNQEKICIFGDYDVDGATSSALLISFFKYLHVNVTSYIPDRVKEGYGPNSNAMREIASNGTKLVITVDCGISSFLPLEDANKIGLDVIVIDHHKVEKKLPKAVAVVNPNREDDHSDQGHLAAVGVVFLFIVALNSRLSKNGWYLDSDIKKPDLMQWLDLVALGTVCDVVPLKKLNRAFVKQGLSVISLKKNKGINALCNIININGDISSSDLGYRIGPRINAGGRVGEATLGTRLLSSQIYDEALGIALRLDEYNSNRKEIELLVLKQATKQAKEKLLSNDKVIFVSHSDWHPGVIGIVASRLKEKFNLPVFVVAIDGGMSKGSGRSINGVDLGKIILGARNKDIIFNGGGHAMAAGFTVNEDSLGILEQYIKDEVVLQTSGKFTNPVYRISALISSDGLDKSLLDDLKLLEPFGSGNEEPKIAIVSANIVKSNLVGQGHVRCFITTKSKGYIQAIAFNCMDNKLGHALLDTNSRSMHLVGQIRENTWQNKSNIQFIIEDGAWA